MNEIVNGKKRITAETARQIALAFGTSPDLWLKLENTYQLFKSRKPDAGIARRARKVPMIG